MNIDPITWALIANELNPEDRRAFLKALTKPGVKTKLKEVFASQTFSLPDPSSPNYNQVVLERLQKGLAPPEEFFEEQRWMPLQSRDKKLQDFIYTFLKEYLRHGFVLGPHLEPMLSKLNLRYGIEHVLFYLINDIYEYGNVDFNLEWEINLDTDILWENVPSELYLPLLFIFIEILDEIPYSRNDVTQSGFYKKLYENSTSTHIDWILPTIEPYLHDYDISKHKMKQVASILSGIVDRSLAYSSLKEMYLNMNDILAYSSKGMVEEFQHILLHKVLPKYFGIKYF